MKFLSLTKLTSFTVSSSISGFTFALRRNLHKDNGGLSSCIDLRVTEYGLMREMNLISVANGDYSFYKAGYLSHSSCLYSQVYRRTGSFQQYFGK